MTGNPNLFLRSPPLLQRVVASFEAAIRREIKAFFVCHPMENFPRKVNTTGDTNCKGKTKAAANIAKKEKNNNNNNKPVKLSTDPQSVAARERRHRISDRFKILQSLVPGGTKMNTVSMLEEAIHYVKFLKAQIWLYQAMMSSMADDTLPPPPPPPTSSYFPSVPPPPQDSVWSSVATPITALPDPPVTPTPSLPLYCFQADESHETMFSTFSINK